MLLNINDANIRETLFSFIQYFNKHCDGDFIDIENERYYVNVNTDHISI